MTRYLTLRFEVDDDEVSVGALIDLAETIVAQQIDPDPPILTYDGAYLEVTED